MTENSRDYRPRWLEPRILDASRQFPVVLVGGPRQVGKTTMLRRIAGEPRRAYASLDDPTLAALGRDDPALFLQRFPPPALIDEVQYAPELLPLVKLAVDRAGEPGAYWLTGSQPFHLMKGVTESLAGRVALLTLLGFARREALGLTREAQPFLPATEVRPPEGTGLDHAGVFAAVWRGSFPALVTGQVRDHGLFFSSYFRTYLERDVMALAQVGDRGAFVRFVRACAARTAQLLNLSELARDVDVSVPTAKHWLSILEASHQVVLVPPYHSNRTKRLTKTPKMYFLDTGLASYLGGWSSPETLAAGAMAGSLFETWVVGEILKSWYFAGREPALSFYRDRDGREIDLLLEADGRLHPVEVKLGATPKPAWCRHFRAVERLDLPVGPGAVVCLCEQPVPLGETVTAIPAGAL